MAKQSDTPEPMDLPMPESEERAVRMTTKISAGTVEEEWIEQLKGYDLHMMSYTRDCSRLTLRAVDCIADRPEINLVFHDVSYVQMPLRAHNVRARVASDKERANVQRAVGENFRLSSVVAFEDRRSYVYIVEYGFLQWLVTS